MDKRVWTLPVAVAEQFEASEYVAACWSVTCDIERGCGYFDTNGVPGVQTIIDAQDSNGEYEADFEFVCSGNGCSTASNPVTHVVSGLGGSMPEANGYWLPAGNANGSAAYPVFVFELDLYPGDASKSKYHVSKLEDVKWESRPNAS